MRKLECELISNETIRTYDEEKERLSFYENAFPLTYNQVHIGNVYLFQGLIHFKETGDGKLATQYFDNAAKFWNGELHKYYTNVFTSGLRKVNLFKKLIMQEVKN